MCIEEGRAHHIAQIYFGIGFSSLYTVASSRRRCRGPSSSRKGLCRYFAFQFVGEAVGRLVITVLKGFTFLILIKGLSIFPELFDVVVAALKSHIQSKHTHRWQLKGSNFYCQGSPKLAWRCIDSAAASRHRRVGHHW